MTQPVFARANDPSRRVDAAASAPVAKGGWGRDLRLVLTTIGFTSLAWLIIGGLLMGWLWSDRPDEEPLVTDADRALTDADRALADGGADRSARQRSASALAVAVALCVWRPASRGFHHRGRPLVGSVHEVPADC